MLYINTIKIFFSLSIILVAFLYLLGYTFIGNNLTVGLAIVIPVCCVYFIIAAFSQPYKNLYINILNVLTFTFTGIVVGSVWFFYINTSMAFMIVSATCDTFYIFTSFYHLQPHSFCKKVVNKF